MASKPVYRCRCNECKVKHCDTFDYHCSINRVIAEFDERSRRLFAGLLARQMGRGGIARVVEITGLSRMTIRRGLRECEAGQSIESDRVRKPGGGRTRIEKKMLELLNRWTNS